MTRALGVIAGVAALAACWSSVAAAAPPFAIQPGDDPIEIHATRGEAQTFKTSIRIFAIADEVGPLRYIASDLEPTVGGISLPRPTVDLGADLKLPRGDYAEIEVEVAPIERAGTYSGWIEFFDPPNRLDTLRVPLAVVVVEQEPFDTDTTGPHIEIDAEDTPIEIRATVGQPDTFVETIRVRSSGAAITGFSFLPSRLRHDSSDVVVGRQQVELVATPDIPRGRHVDLQVKVTGITGAGVYRGVVRLLPPGRPLSEALVVPLTVLARSSPTLEAVKGSDQLQLRLAHCFFPGCELERYLSPNAPDRELELVYRVPVRSDVAVRALRAVARGEKGRHTLTDTDLQLTAGQEEGGFIAIRAVVDRDDIPADKYTGSLYVTLANRDDPVVVPIDIAVKDGALGAFLVIFGAILVGRTLRWLTGRGGPLGEAEGTLNRLSRRIGREVPGDVELLRPAMVNLENAVRRHDVEEAVALAKTIGARIDVLARIARIRASSVSTPEVIRLLDEARRELGLELDAQAAETMKKIEEELADPVDDATIVARAELVGAQRSVGGAMEASARVAEGAARKVPRGLADFVRGLGFVFAGTSTWVLSNARSYWVVGARVAFGLLLLVLLTIIGMETLYVNGSDSFGAGRVYDYLALIIWGLSAEVAQRTLTNLRGPTPD